MDFQQIQDEVIRARFKESQRESVKRWINLREGMIWSAADWPFKYGTGSFTTSLEDNTYGLSDAMWDRPLAVFDEDGIPLLQMSVNDFDRQFPSLYEDGVRVYTPTGIPTAWCWRPSFATASVEPELWLGPWPDGEYTFSTSYLRTLYHLDAGGGWSPGTMTDDSDEPPFKDQFHYMLVLGAMSTGLKMENDPTWQSLEEEFGVMLGVMREEYLPSQMASGAMQYGRDELGDGY